MFPKKALIGLIFILGAGLCGAQEKVSIGVGGGLNQEFKSIRTTSSGSTVEGTTSSWYVDGFVTFPFFFVDRVSVSVGYGRSDTKDNSGLLGTASSYSSDEWRLGAFLGWNLLNISDRFIVRSGPSIRHSILMPPSWYVADPSRVVSNGFRTRFILPIELEYRLGLGVSLLATQTLGSYELSWNAYDNSHSSTFTTSSIDVNAFVTTYSVSYRF